LPEDYYALPLLTVAGQIEVDIATFSEPHSPTEKNGGVATLPKAWAPPKATLAAEVDFVNLGLNEIHVYQQFGGPKLRAAIELVSPANKDRPSSRRSFALKACAYLHRGISLVVVDPVTERLANLHNEIVHLLELESILTWRSPTNLYAVAYRAVSGRIEVWPEVLTLGAALPELPLWLNTDLCLPLPLEQSYQETCASLRITL